MRHVRRHRRHSEILASALTAITLIGLGVELSPPGHHVHTGVDAKHHHHFFDEETGTLTDIPRDALVVGAIPNVPDGSHVSRVDVVVRVRKGEE